MENRIKSSMEAASARLVKAREDGDIQAEVAATKDISRLGYEEARLSEIKVRNAKPVETEVNNLLQLLKKPAQPINPDPKAQAWAGKTLGLDKMKL
jgi:HEAT repeat protein